MLTTTTLHEKITVKIIKAIELGQTPPWRRPTSDRENDGFPTHPAKLKPFSGVDVLLLNMAATEKGFHSKFWGTKGECGPTSTVRCPITPRSSPMERRYTTATSFFLAPVPSHTVPAADARRSLLILTPQKPVIAASGADIRAC